MSKHRNITLDMIKLFAAYMVVMAHVPFYGKIGEIQDALTRFSVPVFLAAAGFHSTQVTPGQIKKRSSISFACWSLPWFSAPCGRY